MHASIGRMTGTTILLIWESLLLNCQKSGVKPAYRHVSMVISRQELASVNSQMSSVSSGVIRGILGNSVGTTTEMQINGSAQRTGCCTKANV
jgi:hypothetical protein